MLMPCVSEPNVFLAVMFPLYLTAPESIHRSDHLQQIVQSVFRAISAVMCSSPIPIIANIPPKRNSCWNVLDLFIPGDPGPRDADDDSHPSARQEKPVENAQRCKVSVNGCV